MVNKDQMFEPENVPSIIPLFPLTTVLLLPRGQLPLVIFEPRYVEMISDSMEAERLIGVVQPKQFPKKNESDGKIPLFSVGCVGQITQFQETDDDRFFITLTGISRFRILEEISEDSMYRQARISTEDFLDDLESDESSEKVDREKLLDTLRKFLDTKGLELDWNSVVSVSTESLVNALSMMTPFGSSEKQLLIEAASVEERATALIAITEIELKRSTDSVAKTIQ